ncbi:hypothetical protein SAMN05421770_106109 [Granulicella rosea]|uniref:Uncharacterized protein n=1 Tax=Granulicella rosea TaxID=474952 RepID=A0A239L7D3_9BACT|nr:hypothetical protein SAMN05421770_106109 [Granulicella rosea]
MLQSIKQILGLLVLLVAANSWLPQMAFCQARSNSRSVSLCELIAHSSLYTGQEVTTTARITFFKHGTALWDPECRGLGADMHSEDSEHQSQSVRELTNLVRQGGFGDHPVIATMTGIWIGQISSEHPSFLPQPRTVFKVLSASNIGRSKWIERRY